jgi:pimeloyl-ACP methyl ester carboxylesterase
MRIHSTVTGQGEPTVILVHGWTCNEEVWSEQVPALAQHYRVVTLDLPGHGKSDAPPDGKFSIDLFARSVEAVRAEVGAERIVVVGHSMGGPVAIRYAQIHPEHTAGLVLVDGVTGGNVQMLGMKGDQFAGPAGPKIREAMIRSMFRASPTQETQATILKMMLAAPEQTAVRAMDAMVAWMREDPGSFDEPTLAIYADHSPNATPDYLHAHFKHVEVTDIPGTDHFLMFEKPAELNSLLLAFVAKLPTSSRK